MTERSPYAFHPASYESELTAIIGECLKQESLSDSEMRGILRRYPKDGRGFFSKSEIIRGFRYLREKRGLVGDEETFVERMRMKPVRTQSGVAPVTVLTEPFPCPGRCIFCPSDVRMPKSYLSDEPGAQRAAEHQFDPYGQTMSRLRTYYNIGHHVDKVELIVLGGTWSSYPSSYQRWFIRRCFDALNDFDPRDAAPQAPPASFAVDYRDLGETHPPEGNRGRYNQIVAEFHGTRDRDLDREQTSWEELEAVHRRNEEAQARCVGLVLETRPDHLTQAEVERMRRLGATKVQIGYQSLSDRVLEANHRGHDTAATRRAMRLLRNAGLKIHAHWMPNLLGSSPEQDVEDFRRIFSDRDFRPDELKIYPCSLIESAELMEHFRSGAWRPYSKDELLFVLTECLKETPAYCRVTRMIRDIPGGDIVDGNRVTNFRQLVEDELQSSQAEVLEMRSREVRDTEVRVEDLHLDAIEYRSGIGREIFLQYVDDEYRLAGFLRLSLPAEGNPVAEIDGSAMIREVHVYGSLVGIGRHENDRAQHVGLGRSLIAEAARRAAEGGYTDLAVISSVGTRAYYRHLGFADGPRYQHQPIG